MAWSGGKGYSKECTVIVALLLLHFLIPNFNYVAFVVQHSACVFYCFPGRASIQTFIYFDFPSGTGNGTETHPV